MSAVKVIRALLLAHAPVAALVAADKVFAGTIPQGVVLPAIGIKEIGRSELATVSLGQAAVLVTARVQVTVLAKSYPAQKALLQAAKLGPGAHTGLIAGVAVRSVIRDAVGPDLSNEDAGIFEQSRDFKVAFVEAN